MMNGLPSVATSSDVKYPPKVANNRTTQGSTEMDTEKLYETKPNKKIVRIFTVILYMFSVSLGAILLSLYYIFIWKNPLNSGTFYEQSMPVVMNTTCPPTTCPHALLETTQHVDLPSTEPLQLVTEKNVPPIINRRNVKFLYVDSPVTVTKNNGDIVTPSDVDATQTGGLKLVSAFENINSEALQAFLKKRSLPTGASQYTPVSQHKESSPSLL